MPKKSTSYGLGANPELEKALRMAVGLAYGESLLIPASSLDEAEKVRRYFFRQRKRAQAEALASGATLDPNEADPWRGLVTAIIAPEVEHGERAVYFEIRRPVQLSTVYLIRADGQTEEVKL